MRDAIHIQPSVIRLIQQMLGVFWIWHVVACGYWSIGQSSMDDPDDEWAPVDMDTDTPGDSTLYHYVQSYLWAVETTFSFKVRAREYFSCVMYVAIH